VRIFQFRNTDQGTLIIPSIYPQRTGSHFCIHARYVFDSDCISESWLIVDWVRPDQIPRYIRGHSIVLAFVCMSWVLIAANVSVLHVIVHPHKHFDTRTAYIVHRRIRRAEMDIVRPISCVTRSFGTRGRPERQLVTVIPTSALHCKSWT
jgi:hypothetical protein